MLSKLQSQKLVSSKKKLFNTMIVMDFFLGPQKKENILILGTNSPKKGLVQCPECKVGELMVIRNRATTRKRFMGCSNFYDGCKASSPLLQKARMRATKKPCDVCKWPIIIFRYSRNQKWTHQCANFNCKSRID